MLCVLFLLYVCVSCVRAISTQQKVKLHILGFVLCTKFAIIVLFSYKLLLVTCCGIVNMFGPVYLSVCKSLYVQWMYNESETTIHSTVPLPPSQRFSLQTLCGKCVNSKFEWSKAFLYSFTDVGQQERTRRRMERVNKGKARQVHHIPRLNGTFTFRTS